MITQYPLHGQPSLEYEIRSTGYLNGKVAEVFTILGYRRQWSSTTLQGDVAAYLVGGQQKINTPSVGTTYYVNSTSAQDATGGTGVDRVRISYLDSTGAQQTVDANLNGTTAVSIGSGFTFFNMMESWHSVTADREAAGAITISSINGVATESTTMEMIRAGGNRSQSFRYKVPTGRVAYLIDYHVSSTKQGAAAQYEVQTRALIFNDAANGLATSYHFLKGASIVDGAQWGDEYHYEKLPAGAIVKMSVIPSSAADGNVISGSLDLIVMDA